VNLNSRTILLTLWLHLLYTAYFRAQSNQNTGTEVWEMWHNFPSSLISISCKR